jgi:hypothetical protein
MLGGADGRDLDSSLGGNRLCQGIGDVDEELVHHVVPNLLTFDLVEFEGESIGDVMCSQSDMLFQNWVAWLKWSEKLSLRVRIFAPSTFSA